MLVIPGNKYRFLKFCEIFLFNILQAYERGIALFKWPNVYDIWNTYLTKFIDRYGGKKLERARDLFEQALDGCPAKFAKSKYIYIQIIFFADLQSF